MANLRDESRAAWNGSQSLQSISAGSLQRIADAVETMARSYDDMRRDRDYWKARAANEEAEVALLNRRIRALRGAVTRLRSKVKA